MEEMVGEEEEGARFSKTRIRELKYPVPKFPCLFRSSVHEGKGEESLHRVGSNEPVNYSGKIKGPILLRIARGGFPFPNLARNSCLPLTVIR